MITTVRILRGQRPNAATLGHQVAMWHASITVARPKLPSPHMPNHGPGISGPAAHAFIWGWPFRAFSEPAVSDNESMRLRADVRVEQLLSPTSGLRPAASNHGLGLSPCVAWFGAWLCMASFDPPGEREGRGPFGHAKQGSPACNSVCLAPIHRMVP